MMGRAYAPAHITGFFVIHDDEDPLKMGSCGCGLTLEDGVVTEATLSDKTEIFLNSEPSDAVTTKTVVDLLADKPVRIDSELSIPVSGGLGASAAGAFSTALALNETLDLRMTYNELAYAAHKAEVMNRTGLGDVAGIVSGGVTIRKKPGTPFVTDRIPVPPLNIYYVHFGPISTKSVLTDEKEKACINKTGNKCLKSLLKKPTFDHFMSLSKDFAVSTGLISNKALDAVEAVESHGGMASMAMLGDTVFSTIPDGLVESYEVVKTKISMAGAYQVIQ